MQVTIDGELKTVEIRSITMKKYLEIIKKASKTVMIGDKMQTDLDSSSFRLEMFKSAVGDYIYVEKLSMTDGLKLEEAVTEVNNNQISFREPPVSKS